MGATPWLEGPTLMKTVRKVPNKHAKHAKQADSGSLAPAAEPVRRPPTRWQRWLLAVAAIAMLGWLIALALLAAR